MFRTVMLEARKERAWNSPDAQRRRACAQVNDDTATQALRSMSDAELAVHIDALDKEHQMKRHALQMAADALARALQVQWLRRQS